jgi:hypothetical protein
MLSKKTARRGTRQSRRLRIADGFAVCGLKATLTRYFEIVGGDALTARLALTRIPELHLWQTFLNFEGSRDFGRLSRIGRLLCRERRRRPKVWRMSISRMSPAGARRPSCSPKTRRGGLRRMFSLLTWRIRTLRCCDVVTNDGSWRRLCREYGSWGRLCREYGSSRIHPRYPGRPAMVGAVPSKMRLGKLSAGHNALLTKRPRGSRQ